MDHALPNFTCEQTTQRYIPIDPGPRIREVRSDDVIHDTISATVTYKNGSNEYSDVKIARHPSKTSLFNLAGPIVAGDFGSGCYRYSARRRQRRSRFEGATDSPQDEDYVFDLRIPAAKNHAFSYYENGADTLPVSPARFL